MIHFQFNLFHLPSSLVDYENTISQTSLLVSFFSARVVQRHRDLTVVLCPLPQASKSCELIGVDTMASRFQLMLPSFSTYTETPIEYKILGELLNPVSSVDRVQGMQCIWKELSRYRSKPKMLRNNNVPCITTFLMPRSTFPMPLHLHQPSTSASLHYSAADSCDSSTLSLHRVRPCEGV